MAASGSLMLASSSPALRISSSRVEIQRRGNGFLGAKFEELSLKSCSSRRCVRGVKVEASSAAAVAEGEVETKFVPRLKKIYLEKVVPAMQEEFKYVNALEVPAVKKIVINCGVGEAAQNAKALEGAVRDLSLITGQKPVTTRAKKAIAGFKLREGVAVGVALTLRGEVMYAFLDRLLNLALPRTRDFQGVNPASLDGKGNFNMGVREQSVFPEIRFENIDRERGMDVSIISSAKNDTEGQKLLSLLGMPFQKGSGVKSAAARRKAKDVYRGAAQKRSKRK